MQSPCVVSSLARRELCLPTALDESSVREAQQAQRIDHIGHVLLAQVHHPARQVLAHGLQEPIMPKLQQAHAVHDVGEALASELL
eukprot:CAMPEP_0171267378 /NCGR_PEP_ID=MMETSP0790-20130122/59127_1 /TAXON_ID=2925 /ORGANISM="Alexandrium catenella, Strain OF101" /LENGTH=84 /DNA_ID=CAMNT_0011736111 /DNA_START=41 /DNA_END=294 /DNA_ORIENTATION=-